MCALGSQRATNYIAFCIAWCLSVLKGSEIPIDSYRQRVETLRIVRLVVKLFSARKAVFQLKVEPWFSIFKLNVFAGRFFKTFVSKKYYETFPRFFTVLNSVIELTSRLIKKRYYSFLACAVIVL